MERQTQNSIVALLGLLAVAGYQNRDKIAEVLRGRKQEQAGAPGQNPQQVDQGGVYFRVLIVQLKIVPLPVFLETADDNATRAVMATGERVFGGWY